ncbi:MAG: exosortase, partial [Deltaproteobacteria bacterium]
MNNNAEKQVVMAGAASKQGAWMQAGIFILVFAFAYSATLTLMVRTWFFSADAYHGVLVPFISLYFVWAHRERLKKIPVSPNIIGGVALFIIGNLILLLGRAGSVIMVELFSMVVIIPAIVLMLLGARFLRALILPLSYLVLMVPFLDAVDEIHRPFQDMSAAMGVRLLSLLNIPVFHNGLYLELPGIVLEVAVACSGLNFLLSIIAVSVPLAVFTLNRVWQRAVLIALGVFIGVVSNWFRITLIGVWTYMGGKGVHGPLHILQGFFVSIIGFIFLFIGAWALGRFNAAEASHHEAGGGPAHTPFDAKKLNNALIILIALLFAVKGYQHFMKVVPMPIKASLADMPSTIGGWRSPLTPALSPEGRGGSMEKAPFELEHADS